MAGSFDLRLDTDGIGEILKSAEMATMVNDAASRIADGVRSNVPEGTEVTTRSYVTDRAAAVVAIEDLQGMVLQARFGVLTKAATAIGAEVTAR